MGLMGHCCTRKFVLIGFRSLFLRLAFLPCFGQGGGQEGTYQKVKGKELLILHNDGTFLCLRNHIQKSDVVIPLCDTLAQGFWRRHAGFINLKNRSGFNQVDYSIKESESGSKDSFYFQILLPAEDALNYRNFIFSIATSPGYRRYDQAGTPEFAIAKKGENTAFTFTIRDIAPNTNPGEKTYQRIYFRVFEDYRPKSSAANFFTITMKNFDQCFYEAMDVDGEIIGIDKNSLFWRGNVYEKIK